MSWRAGAECSHSSRCSRKPNSYGIVTFDFLRINISSQNPTTSTAPVTPARARMSS